MRIRACHSRGLVLLLVFFNTTADLVCQSNLFPTLVTSFHVKNVVKGTRLCRRMSAKTRVTHRGLLVRGGYMDGPVLNHSNCITNIGEKNTISKRKENVPSHEHELMSSITAISNVFADLCPHGMLPLAYGIAANGGTGPVLATLILAMFGLLSWYSLLSFARATQAVICMDTNVEDNTLMDGDSISAVWRKSVTNGHMSAWVADTGCFFLTLGCLLFYSAFIGDLFGSLLQGLMPMSVPELLKKRSVTLLILHIFPILPLCLLKNLSALKYSSSVGLLGIVYTMLFVGKRMVDGSYAEGGVFHVSMPEYLQPSAQLSFPVNSMTTTLTGKEEVLVNNNIEAVHTIWSYLFGNAKVINDTPDIHAGQPAHNIRNYLFDLPPLYTGKGIFILMNMCCVAFSCHYNSVKYYLELKDRSVSKFGWIMGLGLGGTGLVFLTMMMLGYGTFGANSQALLLNNYHNHDIWANLARFFTGVAILSGYPLMFSGLKSAMFSLAKIDGKDVPNRAVKQNRLSILMLTGISIGACFVTEHELATVIGIVGSIFGSVVVYILPAAVSNSLLSKGCKNIVPFFRGESTFNCILAVFGVIFAVIGTWVTLNNVSRS